MDSKRLTHFRMPAEGVNHFEESIAAINIFNGVPFPGPVRICGAGGAVGVCWRRDRIVGVGAHSPLAVDESGNDLRRVLESYDTGVVTRRVLTGLGQLPAYANFPWPVDRSAVVRWNVDLNLRWMINGTAPDEYIRDELY